MVGTCKESTFFIFAGCELLRQSNETDYFMYLVIII